VAVDDDETTALHQDFKSSWTLLLEADHLAGRRRHDRRARRRRQINAIMDGW
jgi:hypothetical protein